MIKYTILLLAVTMMKSQTAPLTDDRAKSLEDIDFNAANVTSEVSTYELNFEHLCPNAPPRTAIECLKNFKLSQYVTQIMRKDTLPADFAANLVSLTTCNVSKLPDTEITLNIFCYFEGIKETIFEFNRNILGTDQATAIDIMALLTEARDQNKSQEVKDFLNRIIEELNSGDRSLLELVGEIDQNKMEILQDARSNPALIVN
jgi:hypothetical protein